MAPAKKGTSKGAASAKKKLSPKNASQVKGGARAADKWAR